MAGKTYGKAKPEQGFLKLALYGKAGSGKTLTSLLVGEGCASAMKKRMLVIDTERGTDFYLRAIQERAVHPGAFDFDRVVSRSIHEALEVAMEADMDTYGVIVLDSITHLWEAAMNAYQGKRTSKGGIPITAWGEIKRPYKRLMARLLDMPAHVIICGREGVIIEEDDDGQTQVVGTKMKAEGETPHEPHVLGRMRPPHLDENEQLVIELYIEKDRSGILQGKVYRNPTFKLFQPLLSHLTGGDHVPMGDPDKAAEHDAEAALKEKEVAAQERETLGAQIRAAIQGAADLPALKAAWSLTSGKKTKLGEDLYTELETLKDARKAALVGV